MGIISYGCGRWTAVRSAPKAEKFCRVRKSSVPCFHETVPVKPSGEGLSVNPWLAVVRSSESARRAARQCNSYNIPSPDAGRSRLLGCSCRLTPTPSNASAGAWSFSLPPVAAHFERRLYLPAATRARSWLLPPAAPPGSIRGERGGWCHAYSGRRPGFRACLCGCPLGGIRLRPWRPLHPAFKSGYPFVLASPSADPAPDLGCPSSAGVAAPCPRPRMLASGLPRRGEEEGPAPDARRGEKGGVAAGVGRVAANALAWPSTHISMGRAEREPGAALSAGRKGGPAPGGRRGERGGRRRPARQ